MRGTTKPRNNNQQMRLFHRQRKNGALKKMYDEIEELEWSINRLQKRVNKLKEIEALKTKYDANFQLSAGFFLLDCYNRGGMRFNFELMRKVHKEENVPFKKADLITFCLKKKILNCENGIFEINKSFYKEVLMYSPLLYTGAYVKSFLEYIKE